MHNAILVFVRWFQLQSLWIIVSRPGCARCAWDLSSCSRSRLTSCSNALRQALARSWQRQNSKPQNAPESADDSPSFRCDSPESYGLIWHEKSRRFVATSKGLHNTLEGARLHHIPLERNARLRDYDCMMYLLFQAPVAGIRCLSVYQFFQALCGNLGQLTTSPKPRLTPLKGSEDFVAKGLCFKLLSTKTYRPWKNFSWLQLLGLG